MPTTVTLTQTAAPSRSKGRGWLVTRDIFATPCGADVPCEIGETLELRLGTEVRRASRVDRQSRTVTVVATGDPADTVEVTIGSPQPYAATITGAREV
jgi:hypothetical protein